MKLYINILFTERCTKCDNVKLGDNLENEIYFTLHYTTATEGNIWSVQEKVDNLFGDWTNLEFNCEK